MSSKTSPKGTTLDLDTFSFIFAPSQNILKPLFEIINIERNKKRNIERNKKEKTRNLLYFNHFMKLSIFYENAHY